MASSVKKNFVLNAAYQILLVITPIVTTPVLSRTIGAEGNGLFSTTQSITLYFVLCATLGLSNYGVRSIAECGDSRTSRSKTFWEIYLMQLAVSVLAFLAFVAYVALEGQDHLGIWIAWGMWVLSSVLDISWLFFGCKEFRIPTFRGFVTRLASVACILLFVRGPGDVWIYVAAIAGAFLMNSLLLWPYVSRFVDWVRPSWQGALKHLLPNLRLFVPVVAINLYTQLDKIMLGTMTGFAEAGYFDYSEKLSKMPLAVITALGAVVLPKMSEVMSSGRIEEGKRLIGLTMWFMQACAMALSFGILGIAPVFVPVFFGDGYMQCIPIMYILAGTIPIICATNVIGVQYLLPTHGDNAYTLSTLLGAAVNIAVNVVLIPRMGAKGAAIATIAAEMAVLLVQSFFVRNSLPLWRYVRDALPFAGIGFIMMACMLLTTPVVVGWFGPGVTSLLVEFLCGASIFITLSVAFCRLTGDPRLSQIISPKEVRNRA